VTPPFFTNPPPDITEDTTSQAGRVGPCCDPLAAEYVGTTTGRAGSRTLWSCRACGGGWTEPTRDPHRTA
jgi:hypothetical protein